MRAARSQEAAEVKEPGFAPAYARFVASSAHDAPCAFWLSLTVTLLLSVVGIVIAMEEAQAKGPGPAPTNAAAEKNRGEESLNSSHHGI